MKRFCVFAVCALSTLIGCAKSHDGGKPYNRLTPPALNQTQDVMLQKRALDRDNYQDSCLFLNPTFKALNQASVCFQTNGDLTGVQVTDQKATFAKLPRASSLESVIRDGQIEVGPTVAADSLSVGDFYLMKKSSTDASYEIVFQILRLDQASVVITYQVKSFKLNW